MYCFESRRVRLFLIVGVLLTAGVLDAQSYRLANQSMAVTLKGDAHGARLVSAAISGVGGAEGLGWSNQQSESFPAAVEGEGKSITVVWDFKPELSVSDKRQVDLVYESNAPHLRLHWQWRFAAEFGPVEHTIAIENLSGGELWLPLIDSLHLKLVGAENYHHFTVEKGADAPSPEGAHDQTIEKTFNWAANSSTYAHPYNDEKREIIPIEFVYPEPGEAAKHLLGWYAGLIFSGRTRLTFIRADDTAPPLFETTLGLNSEPGPYKTRLTAGGRFETPTAFLGMFAGGLDDAGNQLRPWVREVLGNPVTWKDPNYPYLVNNSWGSGMKVDEPLALSMIGESKELGFEMFHMDAGWFRGVGDWYPDAKKFPHGLAPIADAAHKAGLRFGLWVDWTQAALDTEAGALNIRKIPDWLSHDVAADWKLDEEFKGQTIDIGVPAAEAYAAKETKRIVEDYHLDMLEHDGYLVMEGCLREDHPHAPPNKSSLNKTGLDGTGASIHHDSGFDFVMGSNSTDVSDHATRAYYRIYEQLRREHPGLIFEICNDGGRMVDFGSAAHGDYFSITDTYDPLSNRRAFYDTSFALPAAMLESYVEKWPTPAIENFRYMLRSGMMGWTSVMIDTTSWSAEQHDEAKKALALYKEKLRPLIRDARLYHVSARPDGIHWDGLEYFDPTRQQGVLYAFRGTIADESAHVFRFAGLEAGKKYKLHFEDGSSGDVTRTGAELMRDGLRVELKAPLASELVFIEAMME